MKMLFVCSQNLLRSPTAEMVFAQYEGLEVLSAGTGTDAATPVSADLIEWADVIFAMEKHHRDKLRERFGKLLETKRLVVLRIPDDYDYMDAELIEILKKKVTPHLRGLV
jgi:predicted protein tyrosine phosphatase